MKIWSDKDVATLKKLAGKKPASHIAIQLNRTHEAIKCKAIKMKISLMLKGELHHKSKTSNEDRDLILDLRYGHGLKIKEIADKFEIPYTRAAGIVRGY